MSPHAVPVAVLVFATAFLFGLVEYRRRRPARWAAGSGDLFFHVQSADQQRRALQRDAWTRAITRAIEVLAWTMAGVTAVAVIVVVAGALL